MNEQTKKEIAGKVVEGFAAVHEMTAGKNVDELVIRMGEAPEVYNPKGVTVDGTIETPRRWLEKRAQLLNLCQCFLLVNREGHHMQLRINEKDHDEDIINGSLEISEEMKTFDINGKKRLTNFEMARLIKMNRSCFAVKTKAMELVTVLQNFKAKVDKEIEQADNRRGDIKRLTIQAVQSNLPEAFQLMIPVFRGAPKEEILVEVDVDPDDFSCALVSPDAADRVRELAYTMIDDEITIIEEKFPELVIVEQ